MPARTLTPATTKKANRQPSTPSGRCAPTLVAKKAPAMPPVQPHTVETEHARLEKLSVGHSSPSSAGAYASDAAHVRTQPGCEEQQAKGPAPRPLRVEVRYEALHAGYHQRQAQAVPRAEAHRLRHACMRAQHMAQHMPHGGAVVMTGAGTCCRLFDRPMAAVMTPHNRQPKATM